MSNRLLQAERGASRHDVAQDVMYYGSEMVDLRSLHLALCTWHRFLTQANISDEWHYMREKYR